jgi:hypothetical protein
MNSKIIECVDAILTQSKCGEEFRADFTKYVEAVWNEALKENTTVHSSEPLTSEEIAGFRTAVRSLKKK